jgi:hypothetical protein
MQNLNFIECQSTDDKIKTYANEAMEILKDKHLTQNYKERKIKILQNLIMYNSNILSLKLHYTMYVKI